MCKIGCIIITLLFLQNPQEDTINKWNWDKYYDEIFVQKTKIDTLNDKLEKINDKLELLNEKQIKKLINNPDTNNKQL